MYKIKLTWEPRIASPEEPTLFFLKSIDKTRVEILEFETEKEEVICGVCNCPVRENKTTGSAFVEFSDIEFQKCENFQCKIFHDLKIRK